VREIGLDRRLNFHSLRTSFASWLALDGVSIYQISKLLGHSDVKITQEYYAHLEPAELHDVVDRITFPFSRPPLNNTKEKSPQPGAKW
jgi:integrase